MPATTQGAAAPAPVTTGRRERKAAQTRSRILTAARDAMSAGGPESLTINDIAERADVAVGTVYNYFESRDEVIDEVIYDVIETLGQRLDALTLEIADPAEVYSFSLRHLVGTAISDPVWGWFVVRLGIAHNGLVAVLGPRASRDLQYGVDAGRFEIEDVPLASAMTFGSLVSVMQHVLLSEDTHDKPVQLYAETLLRMVGIPAGEAAEIVRRPLPPLPDAPAETTEIRRRPVDGAGL